MKRGQMYIVHKNSLSRTVCLGSVHEEGKVGPRIMQHSSLPGPRNSRAMDEGVTWVPMNRALKQPVCTRLPVPALTEVPSLTSSLHSWSSGTAPFTPSPARDSRLSRAATMDLTSSHDSKEVRIISTLNKSLKPTHQDSLLGF